MDLASPPLTFGLARFPERAPRPAGPPSTVDSDPVESAVDEMLGDPAAQPITLDPRERALVSLLVAGYTDTSAARRLHVSPRTVTNMLRALMDQLGVNNRFQLGIAIGFRTAIRPGPAPADGAGPAPEDR